MSPTTSPTSGSRVRPRRNRRYDRDPMRTVLLRSGLFLVVFGAVAWFCLSTYNGVPGRSYEYVEALVPRTGNLISHDPVRLAGRRIGQVKTVTATPEGDARIRLQLEDGTKLPTDSTVLLRANGLLGARYVEIVPGRSSRMLAAGEPIRAGEESLTYGVTEALDVFDRETRGALGGLLADGGRGVMGQGRLLNDAVRRGGDAIGPFDRMAALLRRQPAANARLLPALAGMMRPLDANRQEVGDLLAAAPGALQPFVDRRDAVRRMLDEAPSSLAAADRGLGRSRLLLTAARSLADAANRTLPRAPGGLRAAAALLRESPEPLRRTDDLLESAGPAVPAVLRVTGAADPILEPLHETLSDANVIVDQLAPYGCDIENFGAVFRSMTGLGGFGEGPNGPAMGFRLQAVAPPAGEVLSFKDGTGIMHRDGYPEPCKYLSRPYTSITKAGILGGGGR